MTQVLCAFWGVFGWEGAWKLRHRVCRSKRNLRFFYYRIPTFTGITRSMNTFFALSVTSNGGFKQRTRLVAMSPLINRALSKTSTIIQ